MKKSNKLIYSKRYSEPDSELIKECIENSNENVDSLIKIVQEKSGKNKFGEDDSFKNALSIEKLSAIEHVPDVNRLLRSKDFIEKAKRFSKRYSVSIDIYEKPSMVSVWLLFSTDVLTGEKKHDFVWLLDFADELAGIPHPKNMADWCDEAVILNYMTHHSFVDGRELYPFK